MTRRLHHWLPSITLFLLALAAGVAWRAELELRSGWASLEWLSYFHWAVPLSVGTFIAWVAAVTSVRCRFAFVAALIGFACLAYPATEYALGLFFSTDRVVGFSLDSSFAIFWCVCLLIWLSIPLIFCLLCRLFGAPITLYRTLVSAALFTASWPCATFVRGFVEHRGSPDLIHALKSGFVIPFLVLSLGFPLLRFPISQPSGQKAGERPRVD